VSNQFNRQDQQAAVKKDLAVVSTKELAKLPGYKMAWAEIKMMITNGVKLNDMEAHTLATFALVNNLNPTTGECYLIKNESKNEVLGPVVGIKGFRRKAQEQLGPDEHYFISYRDMTCEAGEDYRVIAELRDTKSMLKYLKIRSDAQRMLKDAGSADATKDAKEIVGEAPIWVGIGTFLTAERSDYKDKKYHPYRKAKKRAEADAIRQRFNFSYKLGESMYEQMEDSQVDFEENGAVDVAAIEEDNTIPEGVVQDIEFDNSLPDMTPDPATQEQAVPAPFARPMIPAAIFDVVSRSKQNAMVMEVKVTKTQRAQAKHLLQTIAADAEPKILQFLFKKSSIDTLIDAEVHGLGSWLQAETTKDGEPKVSKMVATEALTIIAADRS
jgi:hypothetical protein